MNIAKQSLTAVSVAPWIPLDPLRNPVHVGFGVTKIGTGDITFKVQHTFDNVMEPGASATAYDHSLVSGKTASIEGSYLYPISAIRLNVTAVSGVATAALTVLQAGVSR